MNSHSNPRDSNELQGSKVFSYSSVFAYPFFFPKDNYPLILDAIVSDPNWHLKVYDSNDASTTRVMNFFFPYVYRLLYPSVIWNEEDRERLFNIIDSFGRNKFS